MHSKIRLQRHVASYIGKSSLVSQLSQHAKKYIWEEPENEVREKADVLCTQL